MPSKAQFLGDHVSKYTPEQSVLGMDNSEHTKIRSVVLWIIATEREEGILTAFNWEVNVHFNQIF